MGTARNLLAIAIVLFFAVLSQSVYTVSERELAVLFRFGEVIRSDFTPGLHFKVPIYNDVIKFERRILTINNPSEAFLTNEKKNLIVDFFVKWRITDAAQYYRATAGNEGIAAQRLIEIIKDGLRAEFAKRTIQQVVTAERSELIGGMLARAGSTARELGISIVDVRVKRLDLPDEVSDSVFNRMKQERGRVASQLRAEGAEASERIRAEADHESTVILAEAYRDAERQRGIGDARAADIYAKAYEADPEFYSFYRSLRAYRGSIGQDADVLVLSPHSDFFKYLEHAGVTPKSRP
jgi:modulator of FtsH protease HflC